MAEYHLECPFNCSFREGTKWGEPVTKGLLAGDSYRKIVADIAAQGGKVYQGTMSRHKRHIVVQGSAPPEDAPVKANNIEILETIIQKGFQNQKNWKPTISDTMKAMDMWFRLTQGNPFDDLLDTLAQAAIGEEDPSLGAPDEMEDVVDPEG